MSRSTNPGAKKLLPTAISSALVASAISAPVSAQMLEEVMVTATKRTQSVQDVPLAITALSGEFVNKVNLDDVKDLVSYTPGITGNSQDSFIDAISVRGVRTQDFGVGGDPSTAFFKNDLYEGRNGVVVTSMYDIERAEILRGPQGFLFGRSSVGGAISVHTKRADTDAGMVGYLQADVAERGRLAVDGAINIPVSDQFAMRLAGYYSEEDGFAKNHFDGEDKIEHEKKALRWSATYENDRLGIYPMIEYEEREQSGSMYRAVDQGDIWETWQAALGPVELRGSDQDLDSDLTDGDRDDSEILTVGLKIEYDFDFATLTSNTGYKDHDYFYSEDYDGTPLDINNYQQDQTGEYFQQEIRLTSNGDGDLSWYAGASFYNEEIDADFIFNGSEDHMCQYYGYYYNYGQTFSGCADLYSYYGYDFTPQPDGRLRETGNIKGEYSGWATYVNLAYAFTEKFDLEVGFRYTDDEKDFAINVPTPASDLGAYWAYGFSTAEPIQDKKSWDEVTGRVIGRFTPNDDHMFFASYTEGYKPGGFGSFNLSNDADGNPAVGNLDIVQEDGFLPNAFDPEIVDSYEIGYKGNFADGRALLDVTAFYFEYEGLQVPVAEGGAAIIKNVGQVEASGIEASLTTALGEHFTLYLAAGYLDSEATDIADICDDPVDPLGCEGSKLFWSPDYSYAASLDFNYPMGGGEFVAALEVFGEDERGGGWAGLEETKIDAYAEMAARVGYLADGGWHVTAYVENLTDEFTWDGQNNNGGILPSHFFGPKRPRTYGVRFGMNWE